MRMSIMDNKIKISKNMKFDFSDLMRSVDVDSEFTLRDLLHACINSKIPIEILCELCQCNYIKDYYDEAESKPFENDKNIKHLELTFMGNKDIDLQEKEDNSHYWMFDGVGEKGVMGNDVKQFYSKEEVEKLLSEGYVEKYAIEFSPMFKLADLPIRISNKIIIEDNLSKEYKIDKIDFRPSINLIELLYWVFWELSFCGSPSDRDGKLQKLDDTVKQIDDAKKNGTLDDITKEFSSVDDLDKYIMDSPDID